MQDISELTVKVVPLKLKDEPSFKCLHSPHLGSLHFVTSNGFLGWLVNFAFVKSFFKFGGWLLTF